MCARVGIRHNKSYILAKQYCIVSFILENAHGQYFLDFVPFLGQRLAFKHTKDLLLRLLSHEMNLKVC